jgi:hypothetical protein
MTASIAILIIPTYRNENMNAKRTMASIAALAVPLTGVSSPLRSSLVHAQDDGRAGFDDLCSKTADSRCHTSVTDSLNNMVLIFAGDGTLLQSRGRTGTMHDDFRAPSGIVIDDHNTISIADRMNGRIQVDQYVK